MERGINIKFNETSWRTRPTLHFDRRLGDNALTKKIVRARIPMRSELHFEFFHCVPASVSPIIGTMLKWQSSHVHYGNPISTNVDMVGV